MPKQLNTFLNQSLYVLDSQLPKSLCDEIIDYFSDKDSTEGTTIDEQQLKGKQGQHIAHTSRTQRADEECLGNTPRAVNVKWAEPNDWVGPFMYQYIKQANDCLFQYDIDGLYYNELHYLDYDKNHFYHWHNDTNETVFHAYEEPQHTSYLVAPTKEWVRKLSFTLQLSGEDEYEGGELDVCSIQSGEENVMTVPKKRGAMSIFDSRCKHRVRKVKKGRRKALVGWAIGPRWK